MKKLLLGVFCLAALVALVACGEQPATEKEYTLGMGVVVDLAEGKVEFNATVATVVLENGKIVACRLDAVQNKADVNTADGTFEVKNLKTKMEQGDAYGMTAALGYHMDWNNDGVVKEWYDQAKAFEAYVVGKTAAEVKAMPTKVVGDYTISAEDALLAAGCTIQITDFKEAVAKACEDEFAVTFKTAAEFTLGVAAESTVDTEKSVNGQLHIGSEFAASVVVDGKIVASLNDAIQPSYTIKDAITPAEFKGTKRELKGAYGMEAALGYHMDWNNDGVVKEWYLQSAEFSKYVVGKTAAEVLAMPTKVVGTYTISAEDALLSAGCTIQITSIKTVVAESVTNAR